MSPFAVSLKNVLVVFDDGNRFIYVMMRVLQMFQNPRLQTSRVGIVLFLGAITNRSVENLAGLVQTSRPRPMRIYCSVIVQAFPVVNSSDFQFADRFIDVMNGVSFLRPKLSAVRTLQKRSRESQIRKCMHVMRMVSLSQQLL